MNEGITCYERDEDLCEDQMCLRTGCRLRNQRLSAGSADLIKMLDLHVDGVRHYLHLQIGKPLSKDLISAPEIALDNLRREMTAAIQSRDVAQPGQVMHEALEPFAKAAEMYAWPCHERDNHPIADGTRLTVGDLRRARAALATQPPAATVEMTDRCPTCDLTDAEFRLSMSRAGFKCCTDPWHADDHLRARPRSSAGNVHAYVANYRFEIDGGGSYCPSQHEEAMIEDAIEGYIAGLPQAPRVASEPAAWVNGDELDNLLDDRTTLIQGVQSGWRKTPLYRAVPQPVQVTPEMVKAVHDAKCFACGAFPYDDCQRHPQRDCGREFQGGRRAASQVSRPHGN